MVAVRPPTVSRISSVDVANAEVAVAMIAAPISMENNKLLIRFMLLLSSVSWVHVANGRVSAG
jgi:hypothetical protein